jgi:hypothetical protein
MNKTSDALISEDGDVFPATYRLVTAADRLEMAFEEVRKENANKKVKEPLNIRLLYGLKHPIHE